MSPKHLCMGQSPEPGTSLSPVCPWTMLSQPDCKASGGCQVPSRSLSATMRHLLPPTPFPGYASFLNWHSLVMHLLVGDGSSPVKRLLLAHFFHKAYVPPSSCLHVLLSLNWETLTWHKISLLVPWAHVGHCGAVALVYVLQRCPLSPAFPCVPRTTIFANGSLLITQVRARSTGVYKCIGRGQRGKALVLKATLQLAGEIPGAGGRMGSGSQSCTVILELCDNTVIGQDTENYFIYL